MTKKYKVGIALLFLVVLAILLLWPKIGGSNAQVMVNVAKAQEIATTTLPTIPTLSTTTVATTTRPQASDLAHRQQVWLYALEWCESRGVTTAVNKVDRDGTPSYYSFQFKPGTFRGYGEKYGVIPKGLTDVQLMENLKSYTLQRQIVEGMLTDKTVVWTQQFPDCVRKLGLPPR